MGKTGRPREFDRAEALEAAMQLFWEKGFEATSKRDLMEATGVASQSLYNTFGDKRELFLETIRHYARTRLTQLGEMLQAPGSPLENVRSVVRMWGDLPPGSEFNKGCFMCNSLVEFGLQDDEVGTFLRSRTEEARALFADTLEKAKQGGELAPDVNVAELAAALLCVSQGSSILRRMGAPEHVLREASSGVLRMLAGSV